MHLGKTILFIKFTLLVLSCYVHTKFEIENNREWKILFDNFVKRHENYTILIYQENGSLFKNEVFSNISPPADVYNNLELFSNSFVSSEKSLNIFIISNYSDDLKIERKIFQKYSRNIFLTSTFDMKFCTSDFAELVPASFILDMEKNKLFSCFDKEENLELTVISSSELNVIEEYHRKFNNLRGKTLKIYHGNYLSLRCRKNTPPGVCILEGADLEIINALSKTLNFVPDIQRYKYKNYTNIWQEMLHDVNSGEADFVAGSVLLVANRSAHFTSYTWSSPLYGTLFVDPIRELGLWIVTDTFDLHSYIITTIVFLLILLLMIIYSYRYNNRSDAYQSLLSLLKVFVEQGTSVDRIFIPTSTKYLFSLWLILNIIISSSLKSILSSALIKPKTFGFSTPHDLLENKYIYIVDDWLGDFFKASFGTSFNKLHEVYYSNFLETGDQCAQSNLFFQWRIALVHAEFSLVYLSKVCERRYPIDKLQNLRFIKDVNVYHAYPVKPSSPYRGSISKTIGRLHASGLIFHWFHNITLESLKVKDMGYTFIKPLKLRHLFSFFMIFSGALIFAFMVFIVEVIYGKIFLKKKAKLHIQLECNFLRST